MLDVNIMGVLNGLAAVVPIMAEQKSGHIIATDSVVGHVVYPESGTKFAVRAIMEGLRQEKAFQLKSVKELEHDTLWIRYSVKINKTSLYFITFINGMLNPYLIVLINEKRN